MKKSLLAVAMFAVMSVSVGVQAQETPAQTVVATKGKMLYAANGGRLASVYRVEDDGVQFILDGKMRSVPSNTLSMVDGKLTTSLSKTDIIAR
ncbi:hypothetical protein [Solimonas terrae]|uniref:hypothetical protein n=1 Tax=Solimonas terrae TaxID=1396819 RepID=UPI0019D67881|nr:hypothetical protein [Solimonas terrae]